METSYVNKITGFVIALVLGAIMVGGMLAPTVAGIQTTIGTDITLTNDTTVVLREAQPDDVFTLTRIYTDNVAKDTLALNGEEVLGPTGGGDAWNVGLLSDGIYLQIAGATSTSMGLYYYMSDATPLTKYLSGNGVDRHYALTFDGGNITLYADYGLETQSIIAQKPYTWAYVACPYGEGEYSASISGGVGIVKADTDIIVCGAYTTGELDTMYYHYNGGDYVSNSAYDMTMNVSKSLHAGTTDIYDATVSVTISEGADDETFTPYRILVPYQVQGHATSGPAYVMFGVLTLLAIVMLVVIAANAVKGKYN